MVSLVFEKVSDINSDYPYLCIYFENNTVPFMEISINDNDEYELIFYANKDNVTINHDQLNEIIRKAEIFTKDILANKEFY